MPASLIVSAMGITAAAGYSALTIAAVTFGVRLVTTLVIASIIAKRQGGDLGGTSATQVGNRVQLTPSTDNKIPVVYGSAYMKPIITDAKISNDQKTMWYALTFCEAMDNDSIGTISFGDIYWGDKKLVFGDTDNPEKVTGWYNSDGTFEDQPNGNLFVYLYRDGSNTPVNTTQTAIEVMSDGQIPGTQWWTSTNKMTKLAFAIVKIVYSQEKNLTGLAEITAVVNNSLTKPGSVIKDYLTNTRYGAGLPLSKVNTATLTELDAYSDENISYTPAGGGAKVTTNRYRINGPVDTTKNFLDNLMDITDNCDSWLQWNEARGQWGVIVNRSYTDLDPLGTNIRTITSGEIIGGIDVNPIDLNQTYSDVEVQFPNTKIKDQAGYYRIGVDSFPNIVRSPNEPDNKLGISLPYVNNVVQAQYIGARRLLQSREDLTINFTMAFTGITIDAGDVIGVSHETYGWGPSYGMPKGKLFRVTQVQESKADDGTLYARIVASEYNDDVYDDNNIDLADFTPELNTGITNPTFISTPVAPTFANINASSSAPSFDVVATVPSTGTTLGIEYWYGTTSTISGNNYTLYATNYPSGGPVFTTATTNAYTVTGLGPGTYWWAVRAVGARSKSLFSPTASIAWEPKFISEVTGQVVSVTFQPPSIAVPRLGYDLIPDLSQVVIKAYGNAGGELAEYVDVLSDSDPAFAPNTWRIATSSVNNYTTAGVVTTTNVTINLSGITTTGDGGVLIPAPTAVSDFPARITIPVRYKDAGGNIFQAGPATVELTFNNQLDVGPQLSFITPIIGIPRLTDDLVPDYSSSGAILQAELNGTLVPYVHATSDSDPLFTTGTWRIGYDASSNYTDQNAVRFGSISFDREDITEVSERAVFPNLTNISGVPAVMSVLGRYKNSQGTIYNLAPAYVTYVFADQGASAVTLDFSEAGGAFVYTTASTFSPANLTVQALLGNWGATSVSWVTSGTSTATITTTKVTNDTIYFEPSTTTTRVSLSATAVSSTTSTSRTATYSIIRQSEIGPPGADGERGFVALAYIPILVDPISASTAQLTAAWLAETGYLPITNDTGSFTYGEISKAYTYNGSTWVGSSVQISGDLIATGTIRANRLAANEIFTNKLASTNSTSTFGTQTGEGYWVDGETGNAYFGGNTVIGDNLTIGNNLNIGNNCYIGNNLNVAGLINSGQLAPSVVTSATLSTEVRNLISAGSGGSSGTPVGTDYEIGTTSWNYSQYDQFTTSGALYGYWRQVAYTNNLDSSAGKSVNVSFSCNLTFSGANPYPNGPIFAIYRNGSDSSNSGQVYFRPNTAYYTYNHFGGATSYNAAFSMSMTISIPSGSTGNIIGVGFMNGTSNSTPSIGNPGNFTVSGVSWSVTLA